MNLKTRARALRMQFNKFLRENKWASKLKSSIERFTSLDIPTYAAASSYYLLFALFPLILFTISLFNLVDPELTVRMVGELGELQYVVPEPVLNLLTGFIETAGRTSSVSVLSISGIGLLWSASSGMNRIIKILNSIYDYNYGGRLLIWSRIASLLVSLFFGVIMIVVLFVLSFSDVLIQFISEYIPVPEFILNDSFGVYTYTVSFALLLALFLLIYTLVSRNRGEFWQTLIASTFTSAAWLIISFVMSNIMVSSGRYDLIYGSLAAIIYLMLWMFLIILTLMLGGFIHSELMNFGQSQAEVEESIEADNVAESD